MKDEDVIIGMKVRMKGTEDACIVLNEKDYRSYYGNVYSVISTKTGRKKTLNACDLEPYIDIENERQNLSDANNNVTEVLAKELNKVLVELQELFEKNRDAIDDIAKKTEKERIDEEIQKAFESHVKKYGNDFSLFSCYKAGYHAGMKRGDK